MPTRFALIAVMEMKQQLTKAASVARTHPTRITGVLLAIFGALQAASTQFQVLLTPKQFAIFTIVTGCVVAALGFLNAKRAESE